MFLLNSERFGLRKLNDDDASIVYLNWFEDLSTKNFISYEKTSIEGLTSYIRQKNSDNQCLLLGIFFQGSHIGNIKYEPIDFLKKEAVMGILIGEKVWRGKGVASEVISVTSEYLASSYSIESIQLGVDKENAAAISAYNKLGFEISKTTEKGLMMKLKL